MDFNLPTPCDDGAYPVTHKLWEYAFHSDNHTLLTMIAAYIKHSPTSEQIAQRADQLAHALNADGQARAYYGVDIDASKIARARQIAHRTQLPDARFEVVDLTSRWPEHRGNFAILDMLQYLPDAVQAGMLTHVAGMLTPGSKLVIRSALGDGSGRGRTSKVTDLMAHHDRKATRRLLHTLVRN